MRNIKYGICKSNSMDFNCCSSNNRYENYRISMVLMGVFITIINELKLRDNVDVEFEILAEEFKR